MADQRDGIKKRRKNRKPTIGEVCMALLMAIAEFFSNLITALFGSKKKKKRRPQERRRPVEQRPSYEGGEPRPRRRISKAERQRRLRKKKMIRAAVIAGMVLVLILFILIVKAIFGAIFGGHDKKDEAKKASDQTAVITTVGDVIMHQSVMQSSVYYDGTTYNYDPIFKYAKSLYDQADYTVVTPEVTFAESGYTGYPIFRTPDALATTLSNYGFDLGLLGHNHIYDAEDAGVQRSMEVLEQNGIHYIGTRKTEQDSTYLVQDINGIKVGFMDFVYESGKGTINGFTINEQSKHLINSFDETAPQPLYDNVKATLEEMKEAGVDYTIAYFHWGTEYQTKETGLQEAIAQELCNLGVDALIGSHPHVIEPVDLISSEDGTHQMVCCYAIGNHVSNQRKEQMTSLSPEGNTEDGMVVTLTIEKDKKGIVSLKDAQFTPTWVYCDNPNVTMDDPSNTYYVLPLNDVDKIKEETGLTDIDDDINQSLQRTNAIVGAGVQKVQSALPIAK